MVKSFIDLATNISDSTAQKPPSRMENKFTRLPELIIKQGMNTAQTKYSILSTKRDPMGGLIGVLRPNIIAPKKTMKSCNFCIKDATPIRIASLPDFFTMLISIRTLSKNIM